MIAKAEGTIDGDLIHLDQPLDLPRDSRVQVTIQPLESSTRDWDSFLDELEQLCKAEPIGSGGQRYSRDELHERR